MHLERGHNNENDHVFHFMTFTAPKEKKLVTILYGSKIFALCCFLFRLFLCVGIEDYLRLKTVKRNERSMIEAFQKLMKIRQIALFIYLFIFLFRMAFHK